MMQTTIRFWGGLSTIGGNIVSLQYGKYRIISDFGALVGVDFEELLDKNKLPQLLSKGHLPLMDGLYEQNYLGEFPLESIEESDIETIICLSHLHLDHIGSFSQLSPLTPIYALSQSVDFYDQLEQVGLLPSYQMNWRLVEENNIIEHGPFRIQWVPVDHDTLGAASIFVEAPDMKLVYSGDWRLTGFSPEKTFEWAIKARQFEPDILLMEGTTFSHLNQPLSEVDIRLANKIRSLKAKNEVQLIAIIAEEIMKAAGKLVAFNGYPQNMERMIELVKLANLQGRKVVFDPSYYAIVKHYIMDTMQIDYFGEGGVSLVDLNHSPESYVLQIDYEKGIEHLFKVPAGIYLHSNGMPLGSYMPAYEPFVNQVVDAGWEFISGNVSGHASTDDLLLVNRVIAPKVIVPWHTFQPEEYARELENQEQVAWLPNYDETYTWSGLQNTLGVNNEKD